MASSLPCAGVVRAQSKAAADVLFDDAKALMAERRFAEACPKLAESQRIDPAPGTLVWLADCYEQNGQTATAWSTWREALTAAKAARQAEREALATERIAALQRTLSRISLDVQGASPPGMTIKIDGLVVSPTLWSTPTPFDPGPHVVEASAPGFSTFSRRVELAKGAEERITVPPLTRASPAPSASTAAPLPPTPPPAASASPAPAAPPPPPRASSLRPVGVAIGATGALAVVAGVALQLGARGMASDAIADCRAHVRCNDDDKAKHDRATSRQTLSLIVGGVGAGMMLAGGWLLWQSPSSPAHGRVSITPVAGGAGASWGRSW
ncbi:MAG: PEGA domain-containing protein [Polyangiaceae bacterium]|nr:PEGA domain-containing protein [Polyangiaceae bacterium]